MTPFDLSTRGGTNACNAPFFTSEGYMYPCHPIPTQLDDTKRNVSLKLTLTLILTLFSCFMLFSSTVL